MDLIMITGRAGNFENDRSFLFFDFSNGASHVEVRAHPNIVITRESCLILNIDKLVYSKKSACG